MTSETAEYRVLKGQIERRLQLSSSILERLRTGIRLSSILSDVRLLSEQGHDTTMKALIDLMAYGVENLSQLPPQFVNRNSEAYQIFEGLFSCIDSTNLDVDTVLRRGWDHGSRERRMIISKSVFEMEEIKPPPTSSYQTSRDILNRKFQLTINWQESQRVLNNARSFVHNWVADVWEDANKSLEALELLGPDHRFVLDSLSALDTKVGADLEAVVSHLRSNNPAQWQLAALGCRNCIFRLSDLLWQANTSTYYSRLDGKSLEVKRNKEKNRLLAYVDVKHGDAQDEDKERLLEVRSLIHPIYDEGSRGKRLMTMEDARKIARDTFRLCHLLYQATDFQPVTDADIPRDAQNRIDKTSA